MNSSFRNRWSFSYLKFTKYVTNIIAEPKYKYGQQEQVTVRNHNRSTVTFSCTEALEGHRYRDVIFTIVDLKCLSQLLIILYFRQICVDDITIIYYVKIYTCQ